MISRTVYFMLVIVCGGQAGVDRAALDIGFELGISCRGWCPRGRWAEDGPIPEHYPLRETASADPDVRTELNVLESDGTLILTVGEPKDGTCFTKVCAEHHQKPLLEIDLENQPSPAVVRAWIEENKITTLNIAGPRESHRPGFVYRVALAFLREALKTE